MSHLTPLEFEIAYGVFFFGCSFLIVTIALRVSRLLGWDSVPEQPEDEHQADDDGRVNG